MYAHYYTHGKRKTLILSHGLRPIGVEIDVAGKAEARRIAATHNATCWNF